MKAEKDLSVDEISVGDRFYRHGAGEICWIVERRYVPPADGIPHVALVKEDGTDRVVLSLFALMEGHSFLPDRRTSCLALKSAPKRRKLDWDPRRLWKRLTGDREAEAASEVNQL